MGGSERRWRMDDGGLEERRAGGLEDETGSADGKMKEVSVNARPREQEESNDGGHEDPMAR
jgi:hypothetical protein